MKAVHSLTIFFTSAIAVMELLSDHVGVAIALYAALALVMVVRP